MFRKLFFWCKEPVDASISIITPISPVHPVSVWHIASHIEGAEPEPRVPVTGDDAAVLWEAQQHYPAVAQQHYPTVAAPVSR